MKAVLVLLLSVAGTPCLIYPVFAQSSPPANGPPKGSQDSAPDSSGRLDDIVVTAQRTNSLLQTTPLAVTAINADAIQRLGITDLDSLARIVPGASFGELIGQAHITIRGVGSDTLTPGGDPRVAYYQDGVYIARPTAQLGGIFDIEQLQVLKGPQGTLYGRNATGGAIVATSERPETETSGYANLSYGNYNAVQASGALTGPLTQNLAIRVAGEFKYHDGYGRNTLTNSPIDGQKEGGARMSLLWHPVDRFEFVLIGDYHREKDSGGGLHYFGQANPALPLTNSLIGGVLPNDRRDIASEQDPFTSIEVYGVTAIANYRFDWGNLKSISSYRHTDSTTGTNLSGSGGVPGSQFANLYLTSSERAHQVSEEVQLDASVGKIKLLTGVLFFKEAIDDQFGNPLGLILFGGPNILTQGYFSGALQDVDSVAPYIKATYQLSSKISLSAGARYTYENRKVDQNAQFDLARPYQAGNPLSPLPGFPHSSSVTFNQVVPTATIDYKVSGSAYLFATYSQGFKSGGINIGVIQPPFKPETNKEYEIGIKLQGFDGRAKLNIDAFYYDYTNLQVTQDRNTVIEVENAASAKLYGVDADFALRPIRPLKIDGGIALLHSAYSHYSSVDESKPNLGAIDLTGNQLELAPTVSAHAGLEYTADVGPSSIVLLGDVTYTSRTFFTPFEQDVESQGPQTLLNMGVDYKFPGNHYTIGVFVHNALDNTVIAQSYVSASFAGAPVLGQLTPPRTFGISAHVKL